MIMSGFRCFRVSSRLAALAAGLVFGQVLVGPMLLGHGAALAADAARGKILFTQKYGCYQCHGTEGQGSAITGPRLAPDPLPYEALSAFIRSSSRNMPPFREQILPNADLEDIYAYLKSIPPAKDWKTIPLLSND